MRSACAILLMQLLQLVPTASASVGTFSKDDGRLLEKYGGLYIPTGEGFAHYFAPVDAVMFESQKRALSDDDLAAVFPAVRRMDPYRVYFGGRHAVTDASVPLLNQLRSVRVLDAAGTDLTADGLKRLRLKGLRQLIVSPEKFSAADADELQRALAPAKIIRFQEKLDGVDSPTTSQSTLPTGGGNGRAGPTLETLRAKYRAAEPGFGRMLVCAEAVEAKVIDRGKPWQVVREICGDENWYDAGQIDQHRSRRMLYFQPQPHPPPTTADASVPTTSPVRVGWYLVVEYWTAHGEIDRYYFSNLQK